MSGTGSWTGSWRRGLWATIFRNIRNRWNNQGDPNFAGKDYMGNKYFEALRTERTTGATKPRRWYFPTKEDDWDMAIPPEWEAWLRYRRDTRPTEDEIGRNITIAALKKQRAAELAAKEAFDKAEISKSDADQKALPPADDSKFTRFPQYNDYEKMRRGMADRKKDPLYDD